MSNTDYYQRNTTTPAYSLRWSWTGWPSQCAFPKLSDQDWNSLTKAWEQDGIRLLERKCASEFWQATVSTKPHVVPSFIVARLKGRIDHLLRSQKVPFKFSRKVSLRSLGNNTADDVQDYIRKQVDTARFYDADYAALLQQFTRVWDESTDSHSPIEVASGRYWYQLHVVLVVEARHRIRELDFLGEIYETSQAIALDRGYRLAAISVMPDHLHLSLRGAVADSPEAIAMAYLNESCRRLKVNELWRPSYYVGTIGAYNMNAVRS